MENENLLKEKEEVQEFLKNLGIEYRYSCYGEKKPEGCQLLGDYFTQIHNDYEKANKVYRENCVTKNYGRSCSSYGLHLLYGKGCNKDYASALEYFSKGCENNCALGCDYAGKLLTNCEPSLSTHFELNGPRGMRYLEKGCNLQSTSQMFESSECCYAASFLYAVGSKAINIVQDQTKAAKLGERACELGNMKGCQLAATIHKKLGNNELANRYEKAFEIMKKQIQDQTEIRMQRT